MLVGYESIWHSQIDWEVRGNFRTHLVSFAGKALHAPEDKSNRLTEDQSRRIGHFR